MKVLVDTNVLLDVAQDRVQHRVESEAVLKWCEDHPGQSFIAWHTISNLYFIIGEDRIAREFIADVLKIFEIPLSGTATARVALSLPLTDFEDALQVAVALEAGADVIVTRNEQHFSRSPVLPQNPRAFLAALRP